MGERNSSITRVWPVFDCLLGKDPRGKTWLSELMRRGSTQNKDICDPGTLLADLSIFNRKPSGALMNGLGFERAGKIGKIRNAFEVDLPPARGFLAWLLQHPKRLQWPRSNGKEKVFGNNTQTKRKALVNNDELTKEEALSELAFHGAEGSRRRWWAFEGFTSADCMLETGTLMLLIEGKRTEPISPATEWFPQRNQIIRNLECVKEIANQKNKQYAVLVCADEMIEIPVPAWRNSLPHYEEREIEELKRHYLGCAIWADIVRNLCPDLQLPDTLDEAITCCVKLRDERHKS